MDKGMFIQRRKSFMEFGKIYFWTATIRHWYRLLQPNAYKEIVLKSLQHLANRDKIDVFAFVIMPNHIHLIWKVLEMNGKETPQSSFLKFTAHEFKKRLVDVKYENELTLMHFIVDYTNKYFEFWQRDSLAVELYSRDVAYQKLDYLHLNPLAEHWNLAEAPAEYYYSSARFYEEGTSQFGFIKDLREEF